MKGQSLGRVLNKLQCLLYAFCPCVLFLCKARGLPKSVLIHNYYIKLACYKHSSLFQHSVKSNEKVFIKMTIGRVDLGGGVFDSCKFLNISLSFHYCNSENISGVKFSKKNDYNLWQNLQNR
jgi:hypothetical protein